MNTRVRCTLGSWMEARGEAVIRVDVQRRRLPGGQEEERFTRCEWRGDPQSPVRLDGYSVQQILNLPDLPPVIPAGPLPWTLRRISAVDRPTNTAFYMRDDALWRWPYLRHWLYHQYRRLEIRVMATLWVWNLADHNEAAPFTWSEIRWPWKRPERNV